MDEADQAYIFSSLYLSGAMNVHRARMPSGESLEFCEDCGEPIPEARRLAVPGVRRCVKCQQEYEEGAG